MCQTSVSTKLSWSDDFGSGVDLHSCEMGFRDVKHEVRLQLTEKNHDACTGVRSTTSLTELDRANQSTMWLNISLSRSNNDASSGLLVT